MADSLEVRIMSWIDWVIVFVIIGGLNLVEVLCRKYIKSVADFLVAGRGCVRCVLCRERRENTHRLW